MGFSAHREAETLVALLHDHRHGGAAGHLKLQGRECAGFASSLPAFSLARSRRGGLCRVTWGQKSSARARKYQKSHLSMMHHQPLGQPLMVQRETSPYAGAFA